MVSCLNYTWWKDRNEIYYKDVKEIVHNVLQKGGSIITATNLIKNNLKEHIKNSIEFIKLKIKIKF